MLEYKTSTDSTAKFELDSNGVHLVGFDSSCPGGSEPAMGLVKEIELDRDGHIVHDRKGWTMRIVGQNFRAVYGHYLTAKDGIYRPMFVSTCGHVCTFELRPDGLYATHRGAEDGRFVQSIEVYDSPNPVTHHTRWRAEWGGNTYHFETAREHFAPVLCHFTVKKYAKHERDVTTANGISLKYDLRADGVYIDGERVVSIIAKPWLKGQYTICTGISTYHVVYSPDLQTMLDHWREKGVQEPRTLHTLSNQLFVYELRPDGVYIDNHKVTGIVETGWSKNVRWVYTDSRCFTVYCGPDLDAITEHFKKTQEPEPAPKPEQPKVFATIEECFEHRAYEKVHCERLARSYGKSVAYKFRREFGRNPDQVLRLIDGLWCNVNTYPEEWLEVELDLKGEK